MYHSYVIPGNMLRNKYKMKAKVWLYPGLAPWHMVTLPQKESNQIGQLFADLHRGWRSLPITATIGKTSWKTSIFFDSKAKAYIMGLKADVRKKENIRKGDTLEFSIEIMV